MKNNIRTFLFIFIGLLLTVSCSNKKQIIPEKDMVMILKNVYLIDGSVNMSKKYNLNSKDSIEYYEPILDSYGYTTAQFDSSIKYYSQQTEIFDEILDRVIIELSKMEEKPEEKNLSDSLSNQPYDTALNLWPHKTYWDMAVDHSLNPSLGFDIPVKGFGKYTISFDAQIFADDNSEDTRLYVFFFYDDKSTIGKRINSTFKTYPKDSVIRNYKYTLELTDSLVTHFNGWLYDHGGERKDLKRHAIFNHLLVTYKPTEKDSVLQTIINEKPIKKSLKQLKLSNKRKERVQ
ncbi:MAG: DUF4296 domain-containing protein [Bacteroidales bacterium]